MSDATRQDIAISVEGLTKRFGKTEALRGVSFTVDTGSVVGVLGPDGAGKTTTLRVLATLLKPDGGRVTVGGYDVCRAAPAVRRAIGFAGQRDRPSPTTCPCPGSANASPRTSPPRTGCWPGTGSVRPAHSWAEPDK
ncbi:ATP-binding cassette domain-containing protein [Streptomyces sp. NPDC059496]|uniref:ATP-binding cassette domain-containing protein n=1 Tax=Streptomyces sp. NPDC059496 TaxID=3346851 RepID=UPI00369A0063